MTAAGSRSLRRRRRVWAIVGALIVALALLSFAVLELSGCLAPPLDVTVSVRNVGARPLRGLSLDQVDGPGHSVVPTVPPGSVVLVKLSSDDAFGESTIDLVDDLTGHNYGLPPFYFEDALHGSIDVEAARSAPGGEVVGRARCSVDYPAGVQGWTKLKRD
jgi:hypothetical protein